jgi:hypothetical protein
MVPTTGGVLAGNMWLVGTYSTTHAFAGLAYIEVHSARIVSPQQNVPVQQLAPLFIVKPVVADPVYLKHCQGLLKTSPVALVALAGAVLKSAIAVVRRRRLVRVHPAPVDAECGVRVPSHSEPYVVLPILAFGVHALFRGQHSVCNFSSFAFGTHWVNLLAIKNPTPEGVGNVGESLRDGYVFVYVLFLEDAILVDQDIHDLLIGIRGMWVSANQNPVPDVGIVEEDQVALIVFAS